MITLHIGQHYIKHNWLLLAKNKSSFKLCIVEFWGCVISRFRNLRHRHTPHHRPEQYWWTCHATQQRKKEDIRSFNATSCMEGDKLNFRNTTYCLLFTKNSLWPGCISQIIALFLKAHSTLSKQITDQLVVQYSVSLRLSERLILVNRRQHIVLLNFNLAEKHWC